MPDCWRTATDLQAALKPQTKIASTSSGRCYVLLKELGSGAQGQVWMARGEEDGDIYAVKILCVDMHYPTLVREITNHQRAVEALSSGDDFVPKFYEASEGQLCGGRASYPPFSLIVMEYIEGLTVTALADNGILPELRARVVLLFLAQTMACLHKSGIIHRDIKGDNMMVGTDGRIYLCDFGVSAAAAAGDKQDYERVCGTPFYMAPEVCFNGESHLKRKTYDEKVDVWSFGITAVVLAVGYTPWHEEMAKHKLFTPGKEVLMHHISRQKVPDILKASGWSWDYQRRDRQRRSCCSRVPCRWTSRIA
eukprot:TRINITY_DN6091_c0_g1_i2.p1 TRINITY_DN6091_c0_g1~~TRINITY_DN6091_c0_g1_i2.p1  ORF type:complete len:308 (-),score=59.16 TRINITY_DN6091_c0_g1_i2:119-1042(-)